MCAESLASDYVFVRALPTQRSLTRVAMLVVPMVWMSRITTTDSLAVRAGDCHGLGRRSRVRIAPCTNHLEKIIYHRQHDTTERNPERASPRNVALSSAEPREAAAIAAPNIPAVR